MITNRLSIGDRSNRGNSQEGNDEMDLVGSVRATLNLVTQETRFELIQDIVAHPEGMPSLKEVSYANPSKSKSTIRNHLEKLVESGIVEEVTLPEDKRQRDLPWKFFRLSDDGREFLESHGLLKAEETLQEMYSMMEKTERIQRYEDAPRPGSAVKPPIVAGER